ncbi:hypothetical protein DMUE_5134 [Dictyocoela muelleri]|nr:hypothetical protein DMUE_5134 [Dictyocoela muelleri]
MFFCLTGSFLLTQNLKSLHRFNQITSILSFLIRIFTFMIRNFVFINTKMNLIFTKFILITKDFILMNSNFLLIIKNVIFILDLSSGTCQFTVVSKFFKNNMKIKKQQ